MTTIKTPVIKCPHCGAEYLPAEIYIPSDFLPKCKDIVKDEEGHIAASYDSGMNLHEEYTCDYCGHRFAVDASIKFTATTVELHDYKYDYVSPVYPNERIELPEN